MDPRLTQLLEYTASMGGSGSTDAEGGNSSATEDGAVRELSKDFASMTAEERSAMIDHILGGKEGSDAERMIKATDAFVGVKVTEKERDEALDNMLFLMDSIDNAMDIGKTGVLAKLMEALANPDVEIRMGAAWVLGVALKDNKPLCTEWIKSDGQKGIVAALREEPEGNDEARSKYMTVISAALEVSPALQKAFAAQRGYDLITRQVGAGSQARSTSKVLFILSKLVTSNAHGVVDAVSDPVVVKGVAGMLADPPRDGTAGVQRVEMALRLVLVGRQAGGELGNVFGAKKDGVIQSAVDKCALWSRGLPNEDWGEIVRLTTELGS